MQHLYGDASLLRIMPQMSQYLHKDCEPKCMSLCFIQMRCMAAADQKPQLRLYLQVEASSEEVAHHTSPVGAGQHLLNAPVTLDKRRVQHLAAAAKAAAASSIVKDSIGEALGMNVTDRL
jgi:hypothetical protein